MILLLPTSPKELRWAVTPQVLAGYVIDPPVSVPRANGTSPAATAAAGPAEEPELPSAMFHGFLVKPSNQTSS